jgi:hypothetical protein
MEHGDEFEYNDASQCVWVKPGSVFLYTPSNAQSELTKNRIEGKTAWGLPLCLVASKLNLTEDEVWLAACEQILDFQVIFLPTAVASKVSVVFRAILSDGAPVNVAARPLN